MQGGYFGRGSGLPQMWAGAFLSGSGGEMVELGTHKELLERGGAYAEMFRIQAQYYVDNPEEAIENA